MRQQRLLNKATETIQALVTASHGRHHFVTTADGQVYEAHRRGKKTDVVVGDTVVCTAPVSGKVAIESVCPRRNLLFRSDEWRVKELAANIDCVAVVFASRPSFNPWFVWKAIIAAKTAGVEVLIIRNKCDLTEKANVAETFLSKLQDIGESTVSVSAQNCPNETKQILEPMLKGRTTLFVGQSGMGKSTLLNLLCPHADARTREFSEALDLGKQTTTSTCMYEFSIDQIPSRIIDSPGFQEFGLAHVTNRDILLAMPDILKHVDGCRFYNCSHTREPGCAVKKAVDLGEIDGARYDFYCELVKSAAQDVL